MKTLRSLLQFSAGACLLVKCLADTPPVPTAPSTAICSPDGMHTASVGDPGRIVYCQASDNSVKGTYYACHVQALAFSPDGKLLGAFSGRNGNPGKIKVWSLTDSRQLCEITTSTECIHELAISNNGGLVVAASPDGHLEAWHISSGSLQWSRTMPSPAESLQFTANDKKLRVQSAQGEERLLDPTTGRRSPPPETAKN